MEKFPLILQIRFKQIFVGFLTFCVFVTQTFSSMAATANAWNGSMADTAFASLTGETAEAASNDVKEVYDLIALVVDKSLYDNDGTYVGLVKDYPDKLADVATIPERIERYAKDLQNNSPRTIVKTLIFDPSKDTLLTLIIALENLYKNGDENVKSRLRGVVLIGDIPLPVVNKNGNRFISMFPLTDFDDKAYIFNPKTKAFEKNTDASFPKPEIWHGVLRPPQLDDAPGFSDLELDKLAGFFDKNHLYHARVKDFTDFDMKLFYGDFLHEEQAYTEDEYTYYQNFLNHMDDLVYMRFNKHWAQSVLKSSMDDIGNDMFANAPNPADYPEGSPERKQAEESAKVKESFSNLGGTSGDDMFSRMPDIFSRNVILNYHKNYIDIVVRLLSTANNLAEGTGRYLPGGGDSEAGGSGSGGSGIDTVPSLITVKDKFAQHYLKQANDAIEAKVNDIVGKIAEPLPIIDSASLGGTIGGKEFSLDYKVISSYKLWGIDLSALTPSVPLANSVEYENYYKKDGKLYINGISSDFLTSPKQCFPYLGTMQKQPTAEDPNPESSVLTRSIRTDAVMDGTSPYTLGVNGFALSPASAYEKTNGKFTYGFLLESYPAYGIPAFFNNGPLEGPLSEGDVILSITPKYILDVGTTYEGVPPLPVKHKKEVYEPLKIYEPSNEPGSSTSKDCSTLITLVKKDYCVSTTTFDEATKLVKNFNILKSIVDSFAKTVGGLKAGGTDKDSIYYDAESNLLIRYFDASDKTVKETIVIYNDLVPYSSLSSNANAYGMDSGKNWLNGCFFTSGILHDDRCFALTAQYPVLDPAGSYEPYNPDHTGVLYKEGGTLTYAKGSSAIGSAFSDKDIIYEHQFPVGQKVTEEDKKTNKLTYETHKEMFQLPAGRSFDDIDDIYLDGCFNFLPTYLGSYDSIEGAIQSAFSSWSFTPSAPDVWFSFDLYDWTLSKMNQFAKKEGKKNQNIPYGGKGVNVPLFDSTYQYVLNGDSSDPEKLNAGTVGTRLTLADFAKHYGLYDGIDNDGNGITDYKLLDLNNDGQNDSFALDLGEADPKYGLDPRNIYAVSRALLGKRFGKWAKAPPFSHITKNESYSVDSVSVPQDEYWYPLFKDMDSAIANPSSYQYFDMDDGIVLKVKPHVFKTIPSTIIHNEPTNYTIGRELEAGVVQSLPIDDPRYIAFMDSNGKTQKVVYPNLFKSGSHAQFLADIDTFADQIVKIPGSYKLPKVNGSAKEYIKQEILGATTSSSSESYTTRDHLEFMTSANGDVLKDSLRWSGLSIDDKHEYILQYYLNAGKDYYPYVGDSGHGYESAYLVFNGGSLNDSDYIDMSFNRDVSEETDPSFNPLASGDYTEFSGANTDENGYEKPALDDGSDDGSGGSGKEPEVYVNLKDFFKELINKGKEFGDLIAHFDDKVGLQSACGKACFSVKDKGNCDEESKKLKSLQVSASKDVIYSDGVDFVDINVFGLDQDGKPYRGSASPTLKVDISQDTLHPVLAIDENLSSKTLDKGKAVIRLLSTKNPGKASVTITATFAQDSGGGSIVASPVSIVSSAKKVDIVADVDSFTAGSSDETIILSANLLANDVLDTSANNQVTFSLINGEDKAKFVEGNVVNAVGGIAQVTLKPLEKAGTFTVEANVTDGPYYAVGQKEIVTLPDVTSKIQIISDTDTLVSNNKSAAHLTFKLRDKFDNLASTNFEKISVFIFGDAKLDESQDQDALIPGVQLNTNEGVTTLDLYAKDKVGNVNLYAVLLSPDIEEKLVESTQSQNPVDFAGAIGSTKAFTILGEVKLQLIPAELEINADSVATTKVVAQLTKANGEVITGYNGPVSFKIADNSFINFLGDLPLNMLNGKTEVTVQSTTKAGVANISVQVPGFVENSVNITTLPGPPSKLKLTSEEDTIYTGSIDEVKIKATLLDTYDNVAYLSSAPIIFGVTDATSSLITFASPTSSYATKGCGEISVKSTDKSGRVNLFVKSEGLEKGTLSLDVKKRISNTLFDNFGKISPKVLYMNLLGAPFADFGKKDLALNFLYSGQTQAILSTTSSAIDKKRVLFVDGYGQIDIVDPNVSAAVINANDAFGFTKVKFTDNTAGEEVGEMFVVPKDGLDLVLLNGDDPSNTSGAENENSGSGTEGTASSAVIKDTFTNYKQGILVNKLTDDNLAPSFAYSDDKKQILIKRDDQTLASIDQYGRINTTTDELTFRVPDGNDSDIDKSYFSLLILSDTDVIGQVMYKQDVGVNVLAPDNKAASFFPGIYLKLSTASDHFGVVSSYSRYSTQFLKGAYFVDLNLDLDPTMAPGFGYSSIENVKDTEGVGLTSDNKNLLLFAAGNSVGESNIPYASEVGVVLGDPSVRVDNAVGDLVGTTGFTKDVGRLIYSDLATIKNIAPFDYNGDSYDDLLLVFDDGRIKLLENEVSNQRYVDRGMLLNIVNGILSIAKIDVNNDGFDDLLIGTKESCIQGEQCLYLYKNNNGNFERQKLNITIKDKIYQIGSQDLNNDNFPDLVLSDSSGYVYVFWNDEGQFNPNAYKLDGFGLNINNNDLIGDILVHYDGMPQKTADNSQKFVQIVVQPDEASTDSMPDTSQEPVKAKDFLLTEYDSNLKASTKSVSDVNGPPLRLSDVVKYVITLKNSGDASINDLVISDITPSAQEIDESSLKCIDVDCSDKLTWRAADSPWRSMAIKGVSVPAHGIRTITYEASITSTPKVGFSIGDFGEETGVKDDYPDILVRPEANPDNIVSYFYSTGLDKEDHVVYKKLTESPEDDSKTDLPISGIDKVASSQAYTGISAEEIASQKENAGPDDDPLKVDDSGNVVSNTDNTADADKYANDPENDKNFEPSLPAPTASSVQNLLDEYMKDGDFDMIPDSWDDVRNAAAANYFGKNEEGEDNQGDGIQSASGSGPSAGDVVSDLFEGTNKLGDNVSKFVDSAVNNLRCSGAGCLPIPYNNAFLVPSKENPAGGTAVFALINSLPFFSFFYPSSGSSSFRFYLSPTITLGLGTSICLGPSGGIAPCFVASIPTGKVTGGICDKMMSKLTSMISKAASYATSATSKSAAVLSGGLLSNGQKSDLDKQKNKQGDASHNGSYGSDNNQLTFQDSVNVRIPGFPAFFTNWIDAQMEEIYNKLLDLPNFYIILPNFIRDPKILFTPTKIAKSTNGGIIRSIQDFMKTVSTIPLIQIEGKEVPVKIPIVSGDQIDKWKRQAENFVQSLKDQWERTKKFWKCDSTLDTKTICEKVSLRMDLFLSNIQKVLDTLEYYKNLPKQILQLRTAQVKYASQIVCYLDSVMELTGGYIRRQGRIIKAWEKMIKDLINQFKNWKALLNFAVEYKTSCDDCKNSRYGQIGMILQLFATFPDLPVIPIPKWPNFVFDFSKIQLGAKIIWPDIVFKPQPITLPNLPTVVFPELIPDINIDLDGLIPSFDIAKYLPPKFEIDLPDLPPLPLPKLPDLPRPPKIPKLPQVIFDIVSSLKPIMKILCLIKKGLFVFPESTIKAEIEKLTEAGVKPVLPITMNLGGSLPSISYDAPTEFQIILRAKFGASTSILYDSVKYAADYLNSKTEGWVKKLNSYSSAIDNAFSSTLNLDRQMKEKLNIGPTWEIDGPKIRDEIKKKLESNNINGTDPFYYIAADQTFDVNELGNAADEIASVDVAGDEVGGIADIPYMKDLANLRNSLLSYANNLEDENKNLAEIGSSEDLSRFIADYSGTSGSGHGKSVSEELTQSLNKIASNNFETDGDQNNGGENVQSFQFLQDNGSEDVNGSVNVASQDSGVGENSSGSKWHSFIAANNLYPNSDTPLDQETSESMPTALPPGLYQNGENIFYYTAEFTKENHIEYLDFDRDSDEDLVFSLGGNVYLKENYSINKKEAPHVNVLEGPSTVSEYAADNYLSVQGFNSSSENNNAVTVKFIPSKENNVVGYDITVIPSLIDMDNNTYEGTYHYLIAEKPKEVFGVTEDVFGIDNSGEFIERKNHSSPSSFTLFPDDILYATSDAGFVLDPSGGGNSSASKASKPSIEVKLGKGEFYTATEGYASSQVNLISGDIEQISIGGEFTVGALADGSSIVFGDKIKAGNNGGANILFSNGVEVTVHENEIFEILESSNSDSPSVSLKVPNGNYYAVIYSLTNDGGRSLVSTQIPLDPQICGDKNPPLPALSNTELQVAITKTTELNASSSFDQSGDIKSYYIDLDLTKDSNNDGDPTNDPDLWSDLDTSKDGLDNDGNAKNDMDNPVFKLGPFYEVGTRQISLNIVDTANNRSSQNVNLTVYVPNIYLDPVDVNSGTVTGKTTPLTGEMPFSLIRKRFTPRVEDGKLVLVETSKKIATNKADKNGQYLTAKDGTYVVDNFNNENIIQILDTAGNVIGEINGDNGNFWLADGVTYKINSAQPPSKSTNVEIIGKDGKTTSTLYFVSDGKRDVNILTESEFTSESMKDLRGTNVNDVNSKDEFEFRKYPANDPNYPNGVYLYYKAESKQMAAIDTSGNILLIDGRMSMRKKDNIYKLDPFVYELLFNGVKIAEVYVDTSGVFDEVQIVGPQDLPSKLPSGVTPLYLYEKKDLTPHKANPVADTNSLFNDLTGELYDYAMSLYYQGVIDGSENFDPNKLISRADFVVTLIKMLCIIPRNEAYEDPSLFYDITYSKGNLPYYYPFVKEAALLNLVNGYGNVPDPNNPTSGMNPFKPEATITVAEATKIIIKGLDLIGAIDSSTLNPSQGEAWYNSFLKAAQDLGSYTKEEIQLKNSYIVTPEEAQSPDKQLTRGEVLTLAFRVLQAYNCLELDKNKNGMSDYCENKYKISDPNADPDKDGLKNGDECLYGTDPNNPDTDSGGVNDGDEVKYGTNPLNGADDQNDSDGDGLLDVEELKIYHTNPNDPDTDDGGVNDGDEVKNQTDPLNGKDDYMVGRPDSTTPNTSGGQTYETVPGIYLVPSECDACPCSYTLSYKADLRKGDVLYTIIVNQDETKIYAKSNEQKAN